MIEQIIGHCTSCEDKREFKYIGLQEGYGPIPDFKIYNCLTCDTTLAEHTILAYTSLY